MIVTATVTAENTWTDPITPDFRDILGKGTLNISVWQDPLINDPWAGSTITLQRRFPVSDETPSVKTGWRDVLVFTLNSEQALEEMEKHVQYRIGCKTGEFTATDDIDLRLSY